MYTNAYDEDTLFSDVALGIIKLSESNAMESAIYTIKSFSFSVLTMVLRSPVMTIQILFFLSSVQSRFLYFKTTINTGFEIDEFSTPFRVPLVWLFFRFSSNFHKV